MDEQQLMKFVLKNVQKKKKMDIQKHYYVKKQKKTRSKQILKRLCFPKSNDELEYDPATQKKIKIYDPKSGETFERYLY